MSTTFIAKAAITINAPAAKVWHALTNPELIKQYLFGTEVTTDWQPGSSITYRGVWKGKTYEDKGKILQVDPEKLLVSTFWSSLSGVPDLPEHYKTITYKLSAEGKGTKITLTQDNNANQQEAQHSEENWKMVLNALKQLLEK
ncbi:MAG: SRPBCC domain-containing protein [Ignavibacteriales bacterium]|nr:SRPBCC domain-containing protein [Ignavibacteriales bacterium]